MKFVIFFLLFSVSYGHSQSAKTTAEPSKSISSQEELISLRSQISQYMESLALMLLDEGTPGENKLEILDEIMDIADINGQITIALSQISQGGIGQNEIDINKDIGRDKGISVWVKSQAELIRRKQLVLNELEKREKELDERFLVNAFLDSVVIVAGGVLFFVPAGQAVSIVLITGRLAFTGQQLGVFLMGAGGLRGGWDIWSYVFGEEERLNAFVSDLAFRDVLTRELFSILSSANPSDRYLAVNLLRSASVGEEALIHNLLSVIREETHSAEARQPAIRALKAVPVDKNEVLRKEVMDVLKGVIDESEIPSLREASVLVLGEIGEGEAETALYLRDRGKELDESDELRLLALLQSGRNKEYFLISISELAWWLEGRNYKKEPLNIQPEIPDSFLESLLLVESWKDSRDYIVVVKEFLFSGILNAKLKISFSEALLSWDDGLESKALLREREVYSNPARDIRLYVENDLFKEGLSEENYGAFQFLISRINVVEGVKDSTEDLEEIDTLIKELKFLYPNVENDLFKEGLSEENYGAFQFLISRINVVEGVKDFTKDLAEIDTLIKELKFLYPNQAEKAKKLEEVVNSYKKTLETIEN